MKRKFFFLLALMVLMAACGPSPRETAKTFASYLPAETESWERQDNRTVELRANTITNLGHVTLEYEGPDDAIAYIVIEAHPSVDAADVALARRERDLRMLGLEVEDNRKGAQVKASVAQTGKARYALFINEEVVVEVDVLAADEANPVSDELFDELLQIVRDAYDKLSET